MEKRRKIIRLTIFLFLILGLLFVFQIPDNKLHLVFCDVGQGDAIIVRQKTAQVLIDGGPLESKGKLLKCLKRQMPFWDRKIEVVVNTHPESDHFGGLAEIATRFDIGVFLNSGVDNESNKKYQELKNIISDKNIYSKIGYVGEVFRVNDLYFDILSSGAKKTGAQGALQTDFYSNDLNDSSLVLHLYYQDFDALLTGDISKDVEQVLSWRHELPQVEILKMAHHGSKTSTSDEILESTKPKLAVISVGENKFGHPSEEVLEKLDQFGIRYLRTDKEGNIEIISDGKSWWIL